MHRKVGSKGRGRPGMKHGPKNRGIANSKGLGMPRAQVTKARPRKHIGNKNVISAMRKG